MEYFSIPPYLIEESAVLSDMQADTSALIFKELFLKLSFTSLETKNLLELDSPEKTSSLIKSLNQTEKLNLLFAVDYLEIDSIKKELIDNIISFEDISEIDDSSLHKRNANDIRACFLAKYAAQFGSLLNSSIKIVDHDLNKNELFCASKNEWSWMSGLNKQQAILTKDSTVIDLSCISPKYHQLPCWASNPTNTKVAVGLSSGLYLFDALTNEYTKTLDTDHIKRFEKIEHDSERNVYYYLFTDRFTYTTRFCELNESTLQTKEICKDVEEFKKSPASSFLALLKSSFDIEIYHADQNYVIKIPYPLLVKHFISKIQIGFDKLGEKLIIWHDSEKPRAINLKDLNALNQFVSSEISVPQMELVARSFFFKQSVDLTKNSALKKGFDELPENFKKIIGKQCRIRTKEQNNIATLKDKVLDFYYRK